MAMKRLLGGVKSFSGRVCYGGSPYVATVERGQAAKVMVIGCADSLVDPAHLLRSSVGEVFVHRNVAALVPAFREDGSGGIACTAAALEHAVKNLKVDHIINMGHGYCGGINAFMTSEPPADQHSFIFQWMEENASDVRANVNKEHSCASDRERCHHAEQGCVEQSLANLRSYPWVAEREAEGKLQLHGWHFDRGNLWVFDGEKKSFALEIDAPW